ncbi:MAG TPA: hypothetical protein VIJ59_04390 [Caulobacteraceae bacterium]
MRAWLVGYLAATLAPAIANGATRLEIRHAAAHVTIIPEARRDILVGIVRSSRDLPIRVSRSGEATLVDGGLDRRVRGCPRLADGAFGVRVRGLGSVAAADVPRLVIRTPFDVQVSAGDGVSGELGRTASLVFENRGCGNWTIANVLGRLRLDQIGSGAVRVGRADAADLNVAGNGNIVTGPVAGPLTAVSSGEGTISVARVEGPLVARVAGSGAIEVKAGAAAQLNASIAGSGSIRFGGVAGGVSASVAGPGVISVRRATGRVSRRLFGAGRIVVGP